MTPMLAYPTHVAASPVSVHVDHLVIVAGGKGVRLASLFGDLPKVLVPIGEKPVLQHQMELAAAAGIRDVTILAGHLGGKILDFIGDGSRFGLNARVLVENEPLGNAGALLQALDALPEHFFVLYGDVMVAADLQRMARQHFNKRADFTALAHPNDHPHDSDLLEADEEGWITAIHVYPHPSDQYYSNLVNAALYVVRRDALRAWSVIPGKHDFTKDIMPGLVAAGARVLAYRSNEYLKDMGTPARLQRVEADWRAGKISLTAATRNRPTVFLDRDGTLNVEKGFLRTPEGLELFPDVGSALRSLRQAGFQLVVLTNQPVIARGEASESVVADIHRRLEWELGKTGAFLDGIYFCPHHPDRGFPGERIDLKISCDCRKPGIGLFERACRDLHVDVTSSWMIGDQTRDIELARRAGLHSVLVRTGVGGKDGKFQATPDFVAADLPAAAAIVLQNREASAP